MTAWGISGDARKAQVFVVECKQCRRNIPASVQAFPKDNIRVDCPLCAEKRRYRPSEVYLGFPDVACGKQVQNETEHYRELSKRRRTGKSSVDKPKVWPLNCL